MNFDQLKCFLAAAQQDTFFDAAESLHISQSSLSKQIIKLEKELGILLFDRSRRSAVLTPAGAAFLKDAKILCQKYDSILSKIESYRSEQSLDLHIGTLPILTQYHLTEKIKSFSDTFPQIKVHIDEVEERELMSGLESGRYDLIIARKNMVDSLSLRTWMLAEDELTAVVPENHPLTCRTYVTLADLSREPLILMNPYTSVYQVCTDAFHRNGIHPQIRRTARVESILSAVAVSEGIGLLPKNNLSVFRCAAVCILPLTPPIPLPVMLAQKASKKNTEAMKRFLSFLLQ